MMMMMMMIIIIIYYLVPATGIIFGFVMHFRVFVVKLST